MRFIADAMLGRLARWLRLLGYDTLYYSEIEDSTLLRIAREQKRILLTRDTSLVKVKEPVRILLIESNAPFDQLKEVVSKLNLPLPLKIDRGLSSRCSICNTPIKEISKEEVRDRVPEYVFMTVQRFLSCSTCGRVYWHGTHQEKMREKLREIFKL